MDDDNNVEYVGFWARVGASLIDTAIFVAVAAPLLYAIYGRDYFKVDSAVAGPADFLISYVLPAIAVILFWVARQATPGKMAISAKIVDEKTGGAPSLQQHIVRYLGYFVSTIPFGLGLLWVAFDRKKQGWHDKLAGTVVIRRQRTGGTKRFGA